MKTILVTVLVLAAGLAEARDSTAPTLKSVLLEQLKTTHNVQDWFVPAMQAVNGLTVEQANWKDGKGNHSIAQLVVHITFWDQRNLAKFKGEKPSTYSGNNDETFAGNVDTASWDAAVRQLDSVMTDWEKAIEAADDQKLQSWYSTIAHISAHNAYHTGQILYIRKQQGSWDASKGVK
ncbi:MAG TPA: DinB family protein [Thermoanaerobaculia bacterium]